jgi:ribosome recycling factor
MGAADEYIDAMKEEMEKPIKHLRSDLAKLRTGRASLALLDDIRVDYYGAPTPLKGLANLSVPEPRMIIVKPFDPSVLSNVEKAISSSGLGITPNNDGKIIRLVFPELTGERRKELTKTVHSKGEEAKVAIRAVRREYNDLLKQLEADRDITQDELDRALERVQKETDACCAKADEVAGNKEKEILAV